MRCVSLTPAGQALLPASAALLLVTLVGCSSDGGPAQDTKVVFDGQTYTIHAAISCNVQHDGKLVIGASEGRTKLIRVMLTRDYPLVVHSAGFRHLKVRGFTDDSNEVEATKVDNTYTFSGRMPPEEGERASHQFKIDVTCPKITEYAPIPPDQPRGPRLPIRPRY